MSGYGSQTLTLGQTLYYYLGSVQEAEGDNDITASEADPGTLIINFDTSVTSPFTLTIPVTFSASADTATFHATGVSQLINAGSEGGFLFAQVRLSTAQDTTPDSGAPTYANPNQFAYNVGDTSNPTEHYYLMLTYNTPEPATYVLIGFALVGLAFLRKRRA